MTDKLKNSLETLGDKLNQIETHKVQKEVEALPMTANEYNSFRGWHASETNSKGYLLIENRGQKNENVTWVDEGFFEEMKSSDSKTPKKDSKK